MGTKRQVLLGILVSVALLGGLTLQSRVQAKSVPGAPSCPMTPSNSFWHADVSNLPVLGGSSGYVSSIGTSATLKADFGSGTWDGGPIGIPFTTVPGSQQRVPVTFDYADESDPGPYPIPSNAPIEGGPSSTGDRHVLLVDRDACRLWELYSAYPQNGGSSWTAGSGATWDLNANTMRPLGWTSGDAAGLPILPGLVRYDEIQSGEIDHAIRFTAPRTANAYVWPASHKAPTGGASDPPMGTWFRLKASFNIGGYSATNQVILRALKKHGMVLADNGSSWFMSGVPDAAWNNDDLQNLRNIAGSNFEAVDVSTLKVSNSSYAVAGGPAPTPTSTPPATPTPAPTATPVPTPTPSTELVANPGFETDINGWRPGENRTVLTRTCTVAHTGSCSVQVGRTRNGSANLDDSPNSVASTPSGAKFRASVWVRAPLGRKVTLRIREYSGTSVKRSQTVSITANGGWQQVSVTSAATDPGHSMSVDVSVSLLSTLVAQVDDASLTRA